MTSRLFHATYPPHLLSTCVACGNSPQTRGPSQIIHKSGCPRSGWDIGDACTNDDTGEQETIYDSPHHNPERALALGWELDAEGEPISPPFTVKGQINPRRRFTPHG